MRLQKLASMQAEHAASLTASKVVRKSRRRGLMLFQPAIQSSQSGWCMRLRVGVAGQALQCTAVLCSQQMLVQTACHWMDFAELPAVQHKCSTTNAAGCSANLDTVCDDWL